MPLKKEGCVASSPSTAVGPSAPYLLPIPHPCSKALFPDSPCSMSHLCRVPSVLHETHDDAPCRLTNRTNSTVRLMKNDPSDCGFSVLLPVAAWPGKMRHLVRRKAVGVLDELLCGKKGGNQ